MDFMTTAGRRVGIAAACMLAGVVLAAGGCTRGSGTTGPTASASNTAGPASPSVDPSTAAATRAAVAAYNGYIAAYAAASQAATPDDPELAKYVGGGLLLTTRHNIRRLADIGAVQVGSQRATVTSVQANLDTTPPTVTIHACLDYTDLRLVYKADRSPVPGSSLSVTRFTETATVTLFPNGQWLVSDDKADREVRC